MKKGQFSLSLAGICLASNLSAEPCVLASFDRPVPGATDVMTRQIDVQSSAFPGLWQEGRIEGLFYALYANGEGVLRSDRASQDWSVSIKCNVVEKTCDLSQRGDPPPAARKVTELLQLCLLQSNVDDFFADPLIEIEDAQTEITTIESAIEKVVPEPLPDVIDVAPCGLKAIPQDDEISSLQRLLVLLGSDPGEVDGIRGELTQKAIENAIGQNWLTNSTPSVIVELDRNACGG